MAITLLPAPPRFKMLSTVYTSGLSERMRTGEVLNLHAICSNNERLGFPTAGISLFLPRFSLLTFLRILVPFRLSTLYTIVITICIACILLIGGNREHYWFCKIFASFYFCLDLKKIVNFDMAGPNLAEISTLELIHVGNCSRVFGRS